MSTTTIGIKVADRTYYPVLERDARTQKRLVLTTVKDDQTSVQIDLYENSGTAMDTAQYIGSLLIENIDPAESGEAEVELIVGLDQDQTLGASASESTSGERQSLSVSLDSVTGGGVYDIPEFAMDDDLDSWDAQDTTPDVSFDDDLASDDLGSVDAYDAVGVEEQEAITERKRPIMFGLYIVLGVALVVLIVLSLLKIVGGPTTPPLEARGDGTTVVADNDPGDSGTTAAGGGPVAAKSVDNVEDSNTAAYIQPKSDEALGGTWYWIRRGDTLWQLSSSFYRNPWLYRQIATQNNIANPDVIFAGDRIYIPPR